MGAREYILDEMAARGWVERDIVMRMGGDFPINLLRVELFLAVDDKNLILERDLAEGLGRAFDVSPELFLNLEANKDALNAHVAQKLKEATRASEKRAIKMKQDYDVLVEHLTKRAAEYLASSNSLSALVAAKDTALKAGVAEVKDSLGGEMSDSETSGLIGIIEKMESALALKGPAALAQMKAEHLREAADIAMMLRRVVHALPAGDLKTKAEDFIQRKCPGDILRAAEAEKGGGA